MQACPSLLPEPAAATTDHNQSAADNLPPRYMGRRIPAAKWLLPQFPLLAPSPPRRRVENAASAADNRHITTAAGPEPGAVVTAGAEPEPGVVVTAVTEPEPGVVATAVAAPDNWRLVRLPLPAVPTNRWRR